MNEEKMIAVIMETQERVTRLEQNGFTPMDREKISGMFNVLQTLVGKITKLEEEQTHTSLHMRRIDGKLTVIEEEVAGIRVDITVLKDDVGKVNTRLGNMENDMGKVKIKLVIA